MKKEYKVGEIFEYENEYLQNEYLQVMDQRSNLKFEQYGNICLTCDLLMYHCLPCNSDKRTDNKNVYYRFLSKNEIRKYKLNQLSYE